MIRSIFTAGTLGALVGAILAGSVLLAGAQSEGKFVTIDNFTFSPQKLIVKAGTTVTWTNRDDIPHAIAAVDKSFRSKALDTDDNYSFTFTTPGTYAYFCSIHPHMTGTVVVETATGSSAR